MTTLITKYIWLNDIKKPISYSTASDKEAFSREWLFRLVYMCSFFYEHPIDTVLFSSTMCENVFIKQNKAKAMACHYCVKYYYFIWRHFELSVHIGQVNLLLDIQFFI